MAPEVLDRVPNLLLILSGIYAVMGLLSVYLIRQPTDDWVAKKIKLGEEKNAEKTKSVSSSKSTNGFAAISTEESPKKIQKEVQFMSPVSPVFYTEATVVKSLSLI